MVSFKGIVLLSILHDASSFSHGHNSLKRRQNLLSTPVFSPDSTRRSLSLEAGDDSSVCWNPQLRRVMGGIGVAGALETAYLSLTKFTGGEAICVAGGECNSVLSGPYAVIPGTDLPLSLLGFVAYSVVILLALGPIFQQQTSDEDNRIQLAALTTTMGVFSIFLMSILFGVLKESCVYCVVSALFSISLAKLSWLGGVLPKDRVKEGVGFSLGGGLAATIASVVLFASVGTSASTVNVADSFLGNGSSSIYLSGETKGQAPPPITTTSSPQALALASEMESLNSRFFGAFWCSHCYDQKQALGREAMAKIPYIECSSDGLNSQTALCKDRKIPGYPTWEINGQLYPGERSIEELEEVVNEARNPK